MLVESKATIDKALRDAGAEWHGPDGTRQRASHVVSVYDTPTGRFSFTRRDEWVTLVPGAEATLTRQMDELLAQL